MYSATVDQGKTVLSPGVIYESLTVLSTPQDTYVTPLGVISTGKLIYARIYPDTRLSEIAREAIEACVALPSKPDLFYDYFESRKLTLEDSRAIRAPCVSGSPLYIEAVIVKRRRWLGNGYMIYMEPVYVRYTGNRACEGYTRVMGCSIELLINYTRALHWSKKRPPDCTRAHAHLARVREALECIKRADLTGRLYSRARMLAEKAETNMALYGCY